MGSTWAQTCNFWKFGNWFDELSSNAQAIEIFTRPQALNSLSKCNCGHCRLPGSRVSKHLSAQHKEWCLLLWNITCRDIHREAADRVEEGEWWACHHQMGFQEICGREGGRHSWPKDWENTCCRGHCGTFGRACICVLSAHERWPTEHEEGRRSSLGHPKRFSGFPSEGA